MVGEIDGDRLWWDLIYGCLEYKDVWYSGDDDDVVVVVVVGGGDVGFLRVLVWEGVYWLLLICLYIVVCVVVVFLYRNLIDCVVWILFMFLLNVVYVIFGVWICSCKLVCVGGGCE